DGSFAAALAGAGAATDQAVRAARCAVALQAVVPARPMALAMGLGGVAAAAAGDVVDRAARLVEAAPDGAIRLDPLTAGLVQSTFEIAIAGTTAELGGEKATAGGAGALLGQPMPCVGRDREIDALEALWAEARDEPGARVALVTGEAGLGKS